MNGFLKFVLAVVAVVVLGPPALAVLAGVLGLTVGLLALAFKLGVVALGVYAVVLLVRALSGRGAVRAVPQRVEPDGFDDLSRRNDAALAELDAELARVVAHQAK